MPLIAGSQLTPEQRAEVKAAYVHRLTREHGASLAVCPHCRDFWSRCLGKCSTAFVDTDDQWIDAHAFYVTRRGVLSRKQTHAEPHYLADPPETPTSPLCPCGCGSTQHHQEYDK